MDGGHFVRTLRHSVISPSFFRVLPGRVRVFVGDDVRRNSGSLATIAKLGASTPGVGPFRECLTRAGINLDP